jgi:hypothetical protein
MKINKTILCKEKGIHLIQIFEDEWILKKEIVKSIIKNSLGIIEQKIYGRKTIIKEIINNEEVKDFININHIQGYVSASVK